MTMNKETFEALKSVLEFLEQKIGDVAIPQIIEEDVAQLKGWMEEVEKEVE